MTDNALVPALEGDARRDALLRAIGFDKLSEAQRELALGIASRYELDPMLKHLVIIDGRPYITRDGLLHVAHKSGDFDGIETTDPVLDPEPGSDGKRYWRTRCSVWRKSFSRPFVYPGRYPMAGGNAKYAEEMAIKVGEVMTLRRAFDVSAPTVEERWDGEYADVVVDPNAPEPPKTLAERAALRAAEIAGPAETAGEPEKLTESADEDGDETIVVTEPEPAPEPSTDVDDALAATGGFAAPTAGFAGDPLADEGPASEIAMQAFVEWAEKHDAELIKATARELFPDVRQFSALTGTQLGQLYLSVERAEARAIDDESGMATDLGPEPEPAPEPEKLTETPAEPEPDSGPAEPESEPESPSTDPLAKPSLCGEISPLSGNPCVSDAGHKGVHRASLKESW